MELENVFVDCSKSNIQTNNFHFRKQGQLACYVFDVPGIPGVFNFFCKGGTMNSDSAIKYRRGFGAQRHDQNELVFLRKDITDKSLSVATEKQPIRKQIEGPLFDIEIFPNPVKGSLNINYALSDYQNTRIEIIDIKGVIVKSLGLTKPVGSLKMDVSDLLSGNYIIKIGDKYTEKITIID